MIESTDFLLQVAKQTEGQIALQPVDLLADKSFEIKRFNGCVGSLANSEDVITIRIRELLKDDRFCRVLLRCGYPDKDVYNKRYVKYMTEMSRKLDKRWGQADSMLRLEQESRLSIAVCTAMTSEYIPACYEEVKKELTASREKANLWNENSNGNLESFVGFI